MKKTYITPVLHICVISESAMLCSSIGQPNIVNDSPATTNGAGGDDGTDSYVKAQNVWDKEW